MNSIAELPSTDSWAIYKGLFKSKKYTMMLLCDTIGFFSYMIIFQVLRGHISKTIYFIFSISLTD